MGASHPSEIDHSLPRRTGPDRTKQASTFALPTRNRLAQHAACVCFTVGSLHFKRHWHFRLQIGEPAHTWYWFIRSSLPQRIKHASWHWNFPPIFGISLLCACVCRNRFAVAPLAPSPFFRALKQRKGFKACAGNIQNLEKRKTDGTWTHTNVKPSLGTANDGDTGQLALLTHHRNRFKIFI